MIAIDVNGDEQLKTLANQKRFTDCRLTKARKTRRQNCWQEKAVASRSIPLATRALTLLR